MIESLPGFFEKKNVLGSQCIFNYCLSLILLVSLSSQILSKDLISQDEFFYPIRKDVLCGNRDMGTAEVLAFKFTPV